MLTCTSVSLPEGVQPVLKPKGNDNRHVGVSRFHRNVSGSISKVNFALSRQKNQQVSLWFVASNS